MAVDTRLKRQSATCILLPWMLSPNYPETAGVTQPEWQAASGAYSGITASTPVGWSTIKIQGVDVISGDFVYIIGKVKIG